MAKITFNPPKKPWTLREMWRPSRDVFVTNVAIGDICAQCEEELQKCDEVYRIDNSGDLVHVDCFRDYAWRVLVGMARFYYGDDYE